MEPVWGEEDVVVSGSREESRMVFSTQRLFCKIRGSLLARELGKTDSISRIRACQLQRKSPGRKHGAAPNRRRKLVEGNQNSSKSHEATRLVFPHPSITGLARRQPSSQKCTLKALRKRSKVGGGDA